MNKKNVFLDSLVCKIRDSKRSASMADWISENTSIAGKKFSFRGHEFQIDIANDMCPNLSVLKLSQMGITEILIRKTLAFLARNNGTRAMYSFPTDLLKKANAKSRMKFLLTNDFPARPDDVRSTDLMQIQDSFLYVASCSEADATSNPVDMLVIDELDLSDMEIVSLFNSRIQHSQWKIRQRISTPTFTDFGIAAEFEAGDQRQYFATCPHCNNKFVPQYDLEHVYIPNLPKDVEDLVFDISPETAAILDYDNSYVRCPKCLKPIDPGDPTGREWVATYPERSSTHHSYQILPFSSGLLSIKYLVTTVAEGIAKNQARRVINTTLGKTYNSSDNRLDIADIEKCFVTPKVPDIPKDKPIFFGLDMGMGCHLTIVSADGGEVLRFEVIPQDKVQERIEHLLANYNVIFGLMDRAPFIPTAYALRDFSEGRAYPVVYSENNKRAVPYKEVTGDIAYYNVDRTLALDAVSEAVRSGRIKFYGYQNQHDIILTHLRDMVRDDTTDKVRWQKLHGNDHYFHSLGYALTAVYLKQMNDALSDAPTGVCVGFNGISQKPLDCYDILSYSGGSSNNHRILSRR